VNIFFHGIWQRNVKIVCKLVVDRCDRIGRVPWFGIGARHNGRVVALAKAPETISIKVVNPEIVLSAFGQSVENAAGEIDDVSGINLEKICRPENRFVVRASNDHQDRKNHRNQV